MSRWSWNKFVWNENKKEYEYFDSSGGPYESKEILMDSVWSDILYEAQENPFDLQKKGIEIKVHHLLSGKKYSYEPVEDDND